MNPREFVYLLFQEVIAGGKLTATRVKDDLTIAYGVFGRLIPQKHK